MRMRMRAAVRHFLQPRSVSRRPATLDEALTLGQSAWRSHLDGFTNHLGVVEMKNYPVLQRRHLANCKVLPLREDILEAMPRNAVAAEVGVQEGVFSRKIIDICNPTKLHLIDIDLTRFDIAGRFAPEIADGSVAIHEADSVAAIGSFPDDQFDFIYIDADHSYNGVKRDIAAAVPKVKQGGYLLFNDYTFWSPAECMPYGVIHAVNELCLAEDWEMLYLALGYMGYGDVAFRRIAAGG
ncbi:class I SAM-dependent methyltransferase [Rhizorhapis sp.]|uniref:class I SAM-dependent methyltransferase n=1 Tax=Rhizorhapis sp. TaxID=1968842 RepID=UPI002B474953|nr:class I SAM-dependent methyltransferase [Rhizorhapis sp.]HKR16702.1 class I SAM-dependent methyltransferase [Rhizorhapis sp.]